MSESAECGGSLWDVIGGWDLGIGVLAGGRIANSKDLPQSFVFKQFVPGARVGEHEIIAEKG